MTGYLGSKSKRRCWKNNHSNKFRCCPCRSGTSSSIDGIDTDGDGLINKVTAHPNRAQVMSGMLPYYAKNDFNWNDRKNWINDQNAVLLVIKRNGVVEAFDRSKIINGVKKACQGRPVSDADLAILASKVEENLRLGGFAEIDAHDIGLAVLSPLRELDEIAYMRYASVYRSFESLQDFETEIAMLRAGLIGEVAAASTTESNISVSDRDGSASLQKQ